MFVDLPPDVPAQAPTLMLAESAQAGKPASALRVLGICKPMENIQNDEFLGRVSVDLSNAAADYFNYFEKQTKFGRHVRTTLLQPPKNGYLEGDAAAGEYIYRPNPGFHGQDKVVALVELGAYRVKVVYFIKVVKENERVGDNIESIMKYCGPKGDMWKISLPTTTVGPNSLQSLLAATGHNWYIDYAPYLNEEFLPISNPNEWIAKEGSDAAGRLEPTRSVLQLVQQFRMSIKKPK